LIAAENDAWILRTARAPVGTSGLELAGSWKLQPKAR
jgi:hypothetical protein